MKLFIIVLLSCLVCYCRSDDVMDVLVDTWLSHTRGMMNSTKNQESSARGLQFKAKCGAFISWNNCTVTADLGIIRDLSTLKRNSPVRVADLNDGTATVQLDLVYAVFGMHYPNMFVSGPGVKIEYKGIDVIPTGPVPFKLDMVLDYNKGVNHCTNNFQITPPSNLPKFIATVQYPVKANLPLDHLQNIANEFLLEASNHITALINYEKICQKLVNLF